MAYLHKSGEKTEFYPEDLVRYDSCLTLKVRYEVHLLDHDDETVAIEVFYAYPNKDSIRWCFLRHKGKPVSKASVKKIYVPFWD